MALKRHEEIELEGIKRAASITMKYTSSLEAVKEEVKESVDQFALEANVKVSISLDESGQLVYNLVDLKQDFVRTRPNKDVSLVSLKAKLSGVAIDVKVLKDDANFTNAEVEGALRELAEIVSGMPVEMKETVHADWSRVPGEMPKIIGKGEGDDMPDDMPEDSADDVSEDESVSSSEQVVAETQPEPIFDGSDMPEQPAPIDIKHEAQASEVYGSPIEADLPNSVE